MRDDPELTALRHLLDDLGPAELRDFEERLAHDPRVRAVIERYVSSA